MMTVAITLAACGGPGPEPTPPPAPEPNENPGMPDTIPNQPEQTPTAPIPTPSYFCAGGATAIPGYKTAYLTFDDGGYTTEIARSLNEQGMPSTFFVNGNVDAAAAGTIKGYRHAIGLHGWIHPLGNENPASGWWHPYFNVTNDITRLKTSLAGSLDANVIMLRAPGGNFAPQDIFHNSQKWAAYKNAYFYGWDIPSNLDNEPAGLAAMLESRSSPDNAIILLRSNKEPTRNAVLSGELKSILNCRGYTIFKVLPRQGDYTGYDPIGTAQPWVTAGDRGLTHYEDDGITPIPWP
jgi:peptidoglycan/xylan/chitin deacetylase (PgdA/CDA1 family)